MNEKEFQEIKRQYQQRGVKGEPRWAVQEHTGGNKCPSFRIVEPDNGDIVVMDNIEYRQYADFVVDCREDVPALIAEVERLNELLDRQRAENLRLAFKNYRLQYSEGGDA